jgi:hypothetical protein
MQTRPFSVLVLAVLGLLACGRPAQAQPQGDSMFAPYLGVVTGGDTHTNGFTFGFSTAYVDESSWGAEFDFAHSTAFNDVDFQSSGLTTVMFNLMVAPKIKRGATGTNGAQITAVSRLRPFAVAGVGAIRARGCAVDCVRELSRTDLGFDAGGGAIWSFSDIYGIRGDVRYFRYAQIHQDLPRLDNGAFDFWRVTVGGVITW